jgi:hypothetical protein
MVQQNLKSTTQWQPPLHWTALWSVQSIKQNVAGYCNSEKLFDNVHPVAAQRILTLTVLLSMAEFLNATYFTQN